jgi:tripartite-type tricarboxylate transporter receptor subunit TctC
MCVCAPWLRFATALAFAAVMSAQPASAQSWPNRTVRIVVPYAPGGGMSLIAQNVGAKMQERMKQPVIVDNRPGAGGTLGADMVAKSPPDGYTFLLHTSAMSSLASLYGKLPFDPINDLIPVTMVVSTQFVIAGSLKNPAADLRGLVALAKERPDALNYGSSGAGSTLHLFAELFNNIAGIKLVQIPYRSDAAMVTSLITGDTQLAFLPQANGIANVQGNLIRGLGVTGTKRMEALPNVPTASEQGYKGLEIGSWAGLFTPRGTPSEIVLAAQQHLAAALADPEVHKWLDSTGQLPVGNAPAEFSQQFRADVARFAKVIEEAHIPKLD